MERRSRATADFKANINVRSNDDDDDDSDYSWKPCQISGTR